MKLKIILLATSLTTIVCQAANQYGGPQERYEKTLQDLRQSKQRLKALEKKALEKKALERKKQIMQAFREEIKALLEAEKQRRQPLKKEKALIREKQKLQDGLPPQEGQPKIQLTLEEKEALIKEIKRSQALIEEALIEAKQKLQERSQDLQESETEEEEFLDAQKA